MSELETGRQKFMELVRRLDPEVQVVVPTAPSRDVFLISLTKGPQRTFVTVPEDDILDLADDEDAEERFREMLSDAISKL